MSPVGVCRMCVVDVGERVLAASCMRECSAGMQVKTNSPRVEGYRKVLTELLLSDYPDDSPREKTEGTCELETLGEKYGLLNGEVANRFEISESKPVAEPLDLSSPVIAVDHHACILCDRCVRACDDVQSNEVIGRTGKGYETRIGFDFDLPMGESTCVSCGECVAACPTRALTQKAITLPILPDQSLKEVESVCPYCGVGCAITFHATTDGTKPHRLCRGDERVPSITNDCV